MTKDALKSLTPMHFLVWMDWCVDHFNFFSLMFGFALLQCNLKWIPFDFILLMCSICLLFCIYILLLLLLYFYPPFPSFHPSNEKSFYSSGLVSPQPMYTHTIFSLLMLLYVTVTYFNQYLNGEDEEENTDFVYKDFLCWRIL